MSDPSRIPSNVNVEYFRKQAKKLLRDCRQGKLQAIIRLQVQLPRLKGLSSGEISDRLKLADVQQALAREQGFANWAELKQSNYSAADQFLAIVRNGSLALAKQHLDEAPKLAAESVHVASAIGDVDAVRHHLDKDPSLLSAERGGWPPLIYACASPFCRLSSRYAAGTLQCVTLLLDRGADPKTSTLGESGSPVPAVYRAGLSSNRAVYWLLMLRGGIGATAGDFLKTAGQRMPGGESMIDAFKSAFSSTEMRQLFTTMREGLRLNPAPPHHNSFANYYDRGDAIAAIGPGTDEIAKRSFSLFMKHGLKVTNNASGPDAETPLHRIAVSGASMEMAKTLLKEGADPNVVRPDGRTPYELAVRYGNGHVAELLLSHGAKPNVRPIDQLIGACMRLDSETAKSLLQSHPDLPNTLEPEDCEMIVQIAGSNKLETMRMMIEIGFHPTAPGESGATPLHVAAWHGHVEMVKALLEVGSDVNSRDGGYGTSPLAWAAHGSRNCRQADEDYGAVVTALADAGADYQSSVNRWGVGPEQVSCADLQPLLSRLGLNGSSASDK